MLSGYYITRIYRCHTDFPGGFLGRSNWQVFSHCEEPFDRLRMNYATKQSPAWQKEIASLRSQ